QEPLAPPGARRRGHAGRPPGAPVRRPTKPVPSMLTILFDGIAYGMLLFLIASGLAVTLGLMNFINLAHGAFAMAGGYLAAVLSNRYGVPFLASLPFAFLFAAGLGAV